MANWRKKYVFLFLNKWYNLFCNKSKYLLFLCVTHLAIVQHQIVEQLFQGDARHRRIDHIVDVHRHRLLPGGVLEDVYVLSHFRILLEELVVVRLDARVQCAHLGEVCVPVAGLFAQGFVVVFLDQQQLQNRVLLELLKVGVDDVGLGPSTESPTLRR